MKPDKSTRIPQQQRSKKLKDKIKKAALELFAVQGFYNTSSNEIAAKAEVSIGSFYSYFKDKKELFLEVLHDYHVEIGNNISQGCRQGKEDLLICKFIENILKAHRLFPGFHREAMVMQLSDPDVNLVMKEQKRQELEFTTQLLRSLYGDNAIVNMEVTAFLLHNTVESVVHAIVYDETEVDEKLLTQELAKLVFCYLNPERALQQPERNGAGPTLF